MALISSSRHCFIMFLYNPVHQIVVCYIYYSYIVLGHHKQERHL
jgi:hypothetical protein